MVCLVDPAGHPPSTEKELLSDEQLRELLESREAEKEAERKRLSQKANRAFLLIAIVMALLCAGISYLIEWQRSQRPAVHKKPAAPFGLKEQDTRFAKQLFDFVVQPPATAPPKDK